MIYSFKGTYSNDTTYNVGDVAIYENVAYHMAVATGSSGCVPGADTVHWLPLDQDTREILLMVQDAIGIADATADTRLDALEEQVKAKELIIGSSTASSTKKFKITVIDDGTIAAAEIE